MLENLLDMLRADGSIVVNKKLACKIGLEEAAIYSELASQRNFWKMQGKMSNESGRYDKKGEWFYCTIDKLEEHTSVKRKKQDRVIKTLVNLKLIEVRLLGLPSKRYFKITDEIFSLMFGYKIQLVPTGQPDDINVSDDEKEQKPHKTQLVPNGQPSMSQADKLDSPKRTTSNNISINNNSINKREEEEAESSKVVELFNKNFKNLKDSDSSKRKLIEWTEKLPVEVICNEIEFAADNGARTFTYLANILEEDLLLGIKDIKALETKRQDFRLAEKKSNPKKSSNHRNKPVREEVKPEWFDESQKDWREREEAHKGQKTDDKSKEATENDKKRLEKEKQEYLAKRAARIAEQKKIGVTGGK